MDKYLESIKNDRLPLIKFDSFEEVPFIKHGFTTRMGGVSKGIFSSLNFSFTRGDNENDVLENYRILGREIGHDIEDFVASCQIHTTNIKVVTNDDKGKGIVKEMDYDDIDGLMTNEPGIVLCTYFADCVPLFFVDKVKKVIALSHSGWRGTVAKMGEATVERMVSEFGCDKKDIIAAIGPSICKDCYEVSEDVVEEFRLSFEENEFNEIVENGKAFKYQVDLWKANEIILIKAGIPKENIENRRICTCCNKDILFSHRGSHGKRGNLIGFMVIE